MIKSNFQIKTAVLITSLLIISIALISDDLTPKKGSAITNVKATVNKNTVRIEYEDGRIEEKKKTDFKTIKSRSVTWKKKTSTKEIDEKLIKAINNKDDAAFNKALENGANPNAVDWEGNSALMLLVNNHNVELINILLLQDKININQANKLGHTALLFAANKGFIDIIKILLDNKADLALKDNEGYTALDWAANNETRVALGGSPRNDSNFNGKTLTNMIGIVFVEIPEGEFMMGCPPLDQECPNWEKPQHRVKITSPFNMGMYEVTQGQWKAVMGENPAFFSGDNCKAADGCDNYPVENVSWNDIQEFIKKLNAMPSEGETQGAKYRLPTEAEWEYAARGSSVVSEQVMNYYWGNQIHNDYLWFSANSNKTTHPVGQKIPNAFGLYDMSGNVWEWCKDKYDIRYYSKSPGEDPKGSEKGIHRILRGGSYLDKARDAYSSNRINAAPDIRFGSFGFRLVLVQ